VNDLRIHLEDVTDHILGVPLRIFAIIVGAVILRWLVARAIQRVVNRSVDSRLRARLHHRPGRRVLKDSPRELVAERRRLRAETIGSVLRSIASFVIFGMAFTMVLDELGIPIGPLLASAGVAGVALGFGAQSLVRDFLSGIFMILEDQYGVGDLIDTGVAVGTVEEVTLRVTQLRDVSGVVWYVRNGEILRVGNHSQGWSTAVVDVPLADPDDAPRAEEVIRSTADEMAEEKSWDPRILADPVVGVEAGPGTPVTIRVLVTCTLNDHVDVQRELHARISRALEQAGIEVPAPAAADGD
jgi:small-conductance mechanosensitive channel